ncbi:MAG: hypothetical protein J3R72DRAFT_505211 [Linnemannia gamsii]|nr:MAG: hypothetical protein J3R72DRAFT_505211 [Linnemannia gamsii]
MSLFDIPELADLVGAHLTSRDLKACMRVSKTWRALFAPLLWHQVNSGVFHTYRCSFSRLVIKDYRLAQQDHQRCDHNQRQWSVLSRHSSRIRVLTVNPRDLVPSSTTEGFFRRTLSTVSRRTPSTSCSSATATTYATAGLPSPPTETQLLSHLVRQCTNLQKLELVYHISSPEELKGYQELINNGLAGTITDLNITLYLHGLSLSFSPTLLPQDLTVLQRLRISSETILSPEQRREDRGQQDKSTLYGAQEAEDEEPLPSLRELELEYLHYDYNYPPLPHRFLRRCPNLERLAGLPNLDTITLRDGYFTSEDENMAVMLSACRKRWRNVNIERVCSLSVDALINHCCSTLETLELTYTILLTSNQMQRILSNCSRLRSFVTLVEVSPLEWGREGTHILAEDFIDADPSSGSLKPWACEATLQVFRAKISGIPRPDITYTFHGYPQLRRTRNLVLQEAYQGQSQEIQGRVYERLARLTRLERLDLGYEDLSFKKTRRGLFCILSDEEELWMKEHWPKLESVTREFDYEERRRR